MYAPQVEEDVKEGRNGGGVLFCSAKTCGAFRGTAVKMIRTVICVRVCVYVTERER